MKQYLTDDFKEAVDHDSPETLFDTYGTHMPL